MAYFFYSDNGPDYASAAADLNKIKEASTETFEEYLKTNRFGFVSDRITMTNVVSYSLEQGYPANIKRLYYYKSRMVPIEKLLKFDGLGAGTISIPIIKESVVDVVNDFCKDKIQILDVVITLPDGTEIYDYKALNVINRVEAFTWEQSVKKECYDEDYIGFKEYLTKRFNWIVEPTRTRHENDVLARFEKYGYPNIGSMEVMAYKEEVIEKEIICRDSVTENSSIMICKALGKELKKRKFKGLRITNDENSRMKFV